MQKNKQFFLFETQNKSPLRKKIEKIKFKLYSLLFFEDVKLSLFWLPGDLNQSSFCPSRDVNQSSFYPSAIDLFPKCMTYSDPRAGRGKTDLHPPTGRKKND